MTPMRLTLSISTMISKCIDAELTPDLWNMSSHSLGEGGWFG